MAIDIVMFPATLEHVPILAQHMREKEKAEVRATSGWSPEIAVQVSIARSDAAFVVALGGRLALAFGVAKISETALTGKRGQVWMLTTSLVEKHPKTFMRACTYILRDLLDEWAVLTNAIDARYEESIRWGYRLGFVFEAPRPYGVEGRDFLQFAVTKESFESARSATKGIIPPQEPIWAL